ncbi:MAG TPA: hypothetical protein PKC43_13020 [Phycisphaerales bacterium]|nr:hypothetical protein [Phycisphaerales bacterium]HMP38354.1 hypothetical protein [Phycisphaerales bacterium]
MGRNRAPASARHAASAIIALGAGLSGADAGYVLDVRAADGSTSTTVVIGETFRVDFWLSSSVGSEHTSAIFRSVFSHAGLILLGYEWALPYVTGSIFDDSTAANVALPVTLTESLLAGPGFPAGVVDIEFSNVTGNDFLPPPPFGQGLLISLHLLVPADWRGPESMSISAVPDTFAFGFREIETLAGSSLALAIVIPAPGGAVLLLSFAGIPSRRRRGGASC